MAAEKAKRRLGLRARITLSFFLLSGFVSVAIALLSYRILADSLTDELRQRLKNVAALGAASIDPEAFARLVAGLKADMPEAEREQFELSADYKRVSDALNYIRDAEPDLIRYVYTFHPGPDKNTALYVVDADALRDIIRAKKGEKTEEISHFGATYDLSEFPEGREALSAGKLIVEPEMRFDAPYNLYSSTGYAPIRDANGKYLGKPLRGHGGHKCA